MNFEPTIEPGVALAGIAIGAAPEQVLESFSRHQPVLLPDRIVFPAAGITAGYDRHGVYSVMCNTRLGIVYRGKLWAGMTVADVLATSSRQTAWGGAVVVDGILGIGLPLPAGYDDFERLDDFLPSHFVFPQLCVFRL